MIFLAREITRRQFWWYLSHNMISETFASQHTIQTQGITSIALKQDPVSTMQGTGWTNHLSFLAVCMFHGHGLVLFALEKSFTYGCNDKGTVNSHFLVNQANFSIGRTNKRPNKQPSDPWASLLLFWIIVLSMALITWRQTTTIFLYTSQFWYGDKRITDQTNN